MHQPEFAWFMNYFYFLEHGLKEYFSKTYRKIYYLHSAKILHSAIYNPSTHCKNFVARHNEHCSVWVAVIQMNITVIQADAGCHNIVVAVRSYRLPSGKLTNSNCIPHGVRKYTHV